ncbi:MAG TPA: glycosyltransferase [Casimicrobiaceae bacterium]|nr:glycosyltransferase [Casimicrobiaceae bacterium]
MTSAASTQATPGLRYAIDRLFIRDRRIFGWGWISDASRAIDAVALRITGDGWASEIPINHGLARDDVRQAFPDAVDADRSGFVATGYAPGDIKRFDLEVRYADGGAVTVDVTRLIDAGTQRRGKLRQVLWVLRAAGRRLRRGDVRGVLSRARSQSYFAPSLDDDRIARTLKASIARERHVTIVFDHNMGGGANFYREEIVAERLAAGRTVLLCTYNLPTLDYRLIARKHGKNDETYRVSSFLLLDALIDSGAIDDMVVNSPVGFDEPLVFADWVASFRERHRKARLTVAIHDYYAVCPSFFLINAEGRYCDIPPLAECESCIARHRRSYVGLSPPTRIAPWRAIWGRLLQTADELRCFSQSSRSLLLKAHPALDQTRITLIPHRVDLQLPRKPRIDAAAPLTIGVIGHITEWKGAQLVCDIVRRLDRERRDARVVVIGGLDRRIRSQRLRITGPYRREQLVDLIEAHGVNMVLFPSIGAETFSYVVAELMQLQLPIVAFDLGAPPERLRDYANARLCAEISADSALDTLVAFHAELAARASTGRDRELGGVCP